MEYDKLIMIIIRINPIMSKNDFLYPNYELLLIDFIDSIIKSFISSKHPKDINVDSYLLHILTVIYCIKDMRRLNFSEQFLMLQNNEFINSMINDFFTLPIDGNPLMYAFEFYIKLMILKISMLCLEINLTSNLKITFNFILNINSLIYFYFSLTQQKNILDYLSESSDENEGAYKITVDYFNFNLFEFIENVKILFPCSFFLLENSSSYELNLESLFERITKELQINKENKIISILDTTIKLITNLSNEGQNLNLEVNNILLSLRSQYITPHQNTNLLLFEIIFFNKFIQYIKESLNQTLSNYYNQNYSLIKDRKENFNQDLLNILKTFQENIEENSIISEYLKTYLKFFSEIIQEFLEKTISLIKSEFENKTSVYHYLIFLSNDLFNNSIRILFTSLGLNLINEKIELIEEILSIIRLNKIEEEIFLSSSLLKIVNYQLIKENYCEFSTEESKITTTSTLVETVYKLRSNFFSHINKYNFEISYKILNFFVKFYINFINLHRNKNDILNINIIYDLLFLKFIVKEFYNKFSIEFIFPHDILDLYIKNYKGDMNLIEILKSKFQSIFKIDNDQIGELMLNEFFFTNNKTYYYCYSNQIRTIMLKDLTRPNIIRIYNSQKTTHDKLKELFVSPKEGKQISSRIGNILQNKFNNLSSFRLLSLKIEENFFSIKDDVASKNGAEKNKSDSDHNTVVKIDNSGYLGIFKNLILKEN